MRNKKTANLPRVHQLAGKNTCKHTRDPANWQKLIEPQEEWSEAEFVLQYELLFSHYCLLLFGQWIVQATKFRLTLILQNRRQSANN